MKLPNVAGLILAGVVGMSSAQAGINPGTTSGILNSQEKCASALNSYLSFRHGSNASDAYKVQKLEDQVDSICQGYQVKLVDSDGVMTGVVELAD